MCCQYFVANIVVNIEFDCGVDVPKYFSFFRLVKINLLGSKDSWRPFGPPFWRLLTVVSETGSQVKLMSQSMPETQVLPSCQSLSMTVWPRRGSLAHGQTSRTRVVGSRLNRWELTSSELRWGGRCAAGKVRPGHILLGQSRMPPLPPWLRQTTPFQSLRKSCLAYFDFGCILVWSLGKTYISHFR